MDIAVNGRDFGGDFNGISLHEFLFSRMPI
jgi:hypothetical protein